MYEGRPPPSSLLAPEEWRMQRMNSNIKRQDMDEQRVKCIQTFMRKSAQTEQDVLPIIAQCLEGIQRCTDSMDEKEDTRLAVEKYKSGFSPPGDIPFEDLSTTETVKDSSLASTPSAKKTAIMGTISGIKMKKRS